MSSPTTCHLCQLEKPLKKSHIISRGLLKAIKISGPQLIVNVVDEHTKPLKLNYNPHERLLCEDCEQFLSKVYEAYGIPILTEKQGFIDYPDYVCIQGLDYVRFYLFLLSIFWRASIASHDAFENVDLMDLNKWLRLCIQHQTLQLGPDARIDTFIKIGLMRLVDHQDPVIPQSAIDGMLIEFNYEVTSEPDGGSSRVFYFVICGFVVAYYLYQAKTLEDGENFLVNGQILDLSLNLFPKMEVSGIKQVREAINNTAEKKSRFGEIR